MKISVIGAGNVGATCASILADKEICNRVVLLDVVEGMAEGKALDMWQSAPLALYDTKTIGVTNDFKATVNSEVIVITAGVPRKPGMNREDLISVNAKIVKHVTEESIRYSPNATFVVVANPLDIMAYCCYLSAKINPKKVMGMAGILDTARYRAFLADELQCSAKDIQAITLGGHGDSMVPLPRYTTVSGVPITQLVSKKRIDAIVDRTRMGGGELIKLMGTSAWYAPGYATARMVECIVRDKRRYLPVSAYLNGEYGIKDLYFGVPVKLGKAGVEQILEIELTDEERELVTKSAASVRESLNIFKSLNLF